MAQAVVERVRELFLLLLLQAAMTQLSLLQIRCHYCRGGILERGVLNRDWWRLGHWLNLLRWALRMLLHRAMRCGCRYGLRLDSPARPGKPTTAYTDLNSDNRLFALPTNCLPRDLARLLLLRLDLDSIHRC